MAPDAGGSAVTIVATSETIVGAFRSAAIIAVVAITVILFLALRRVLDVVLVLAPLILSALLTLLVTVLLRLPLNFANIIALPLLLGVGVSFNIYFVMNWRAGRLAILGLGDRAGDRVLGTDHRDRLRLAGTLGASRNCQHGHAAADQPGMHAAGKPGVHPGAAFERPSANQALTRSAHPDAMRWMFAGSVLMALASGGVAAQPADCPSDPSAGPMMPLSLDLGSCPGVPRGVTGQAYVDIPIGTPGIACRDAPPPPRDVLRGEPGEPAWSAIA